jgi:hypothetical protein
VIAGLIGQPGHVVVIQVDALGFRLGRLLPLLRVQAACRVLRYPTVRDGTAPHTGSMWTHHALSSMRRRGIGTPLGRAPYRADFNATTTERNRASYLQTSGDTRSCSTSALQRREQRETPGAQLRTQRSSYDRSAGSTDPATTIVVRTARGRPGGATAKTSRRSFDANNPEWTGIVRLGPESLDTQYPCDTTEDRLEPEPSRPTVG